MLRSWRDHYKLGGEVRVVLTYVRDSQRLSFREGFLSSRNRNVACFSKCEREKRRTKKSIKHFFVLKMCFKLQYVALVVRHKYPLHILGSPHLGTSDARRWRCASRVCACANVRSRSNYLKLRCVRRSCNLPGETLPVTLLQLASSISRQSVPRLYVLL